MATDQAAMATMGVQSSGQKMAAPQPTALGGMQTRRAGNVSPDLSGASREQSAQGAMAMPGKALPTVQPRITPPSIIAPVPVGTGNGINVTGPGERGQTPPNVGVQVPIVPADTGGAPAQAESPAPATQDDIDAMIRELVANQLRGAGQADTTEEEALIRQQMQGQVGSSLVNSRARAGRGGFQASGAQMGIEGDLNRAAEMDALDQILGLRRTEDQRSIDNATQAVTTEQGMRNAAANDALRRMALEALQAEMGLDAAPSTTEERQAQWQQDAISDGADTNGDGTLSQQEKDSYETQNVAGHQAWSDFYNGGGDTESLPVLPGPGDGWETVFPPGTDRDGNPKPGQLFNSSTGEIAVYY